MRKKVAFVSGWYKLNFNDKISDDNKFIIECLHKSAKKYFMPDSDVDHFVITNDETLEIENTIKILITDYVSEYQHMLLLKILTLKYIPDGYDYIFVNDNDQIYVNEISSDYFTSDFYIVEHFWYENLKKIHEQVTNIVPLEFDGSNLQWTMGNFFGGKSNLMKELYSFTQFNHDKFFDKKMEGVNFYARYPDELFLLKYLNENQINYDYLPTHVFPDQQGRNYFLSAFDTRYLQEFDVNEKKYPHIPEVKLLHNTKCDVQLLKKLSPLYFN